MSSPINSQAEIAQQLLIELGLGTNPPVGGIANNRVWPVYATSEPNEPDNCITVYDTTNQNDSRNMYGGDYLRHYGLQVRVRSVDHPTGYQKAKAIADALATQVGGLNGGITVMCGANVYYVFAITKIGGVLILGKDAPRSKRSLFTFNCFLVLTVPQNKQNPAWLPYLTYLGYGYSGISRSELNYDNALNNI